jgi:hypothetical protein
MVDLSDDLFKMVAGEKERLTDLMIKSGRFTREEMDRVPRTWWKKWARYHCPEPKRMLLDFYNWYEFWSSFPHPSGKSFFVAKSFDTFKHECNYIIPGYLSDLPNVLCIEWSELCLMAVLSIGHLELRLLLKVVTMT